MPVIFMSFISMNSKNIATKFNYSTNTRESHVHSSWNNKFDLPRIHCKVWMQILCSKSKCYLKCPWIWFVFCEMYHFLRMKWMSVRDKCTRYIGLMNMLTLNQNGKLKSGCAVTLMFFTRWDKSISLMSQVKTLSGESSFCRYYA